MSLLNKPVFDNSIITPFDNTVAIEVGERNRQMHEDSMRYNQQKIDPIIQPSAPLPLLEPEPLYIPESEPTYFPEPINSQRVESLTRIEPDPVYIPEQEYIHPYEPPIAPLPVVDHTLEAEFNFKAQQKEETQFIDSHVKHCIKSNKIRDEVFQSGLQSIRDKYQKLP